jgi:hypothetical protein
MSIITFSLSRATVEVSDVAAGEHMVPGPFHVIKHSIIYFALTSLPRVCHVFVKEFIAVSCGRIHESLVFK